jgi:predicted MPP superfamily phosphohydrolase
LKTRAAGNPQALSRDAAVQLDRRAERLAIWAHRRDNIEPTNIQTELSLKRLLQIGLSTLASALLPLFLKATGLYERGRRNALQLHLNKVEIKFDFLPASFDGYRILHIADPHFDAIEALEETIVDCVRGVCVDLLVLTGDYRMAFTGPFDHAVRAIENVIMAVTARHGVLATLGNHDSAAIVEPLENLGICVLVNETITVTHGGEKIRITGCDDVHRFYTEEVDAALAAGGDGFKIALIHSPEAAHLAADAHYAFYLTGHTHGGQICWPGGKPTMMFCNIPAAYASGLWRCGRMIGYTSRGCGVSHLPVRFFSRGEISIITLRRAASGSTATAQQG